MKTEFFRQADQEAGEGPINDLIDGRDPAIPSLGGHGDSEAFEVGGEGASIALEENSPTQTAREGKRGFPGRHI